MAESHWGLAFFLYLVKFRHYIGVLVSAGLGFLIWKGITNEFLRFLLLVPFGWILVLSLIRIGDPKAGRGVIQSAFFWFVIAVFAGLVKFLLQGTK